MPLWKQKRVRVSAAALTLLLFLGLGGYRYWQATRDPFRGDAVVNPSFPPLTYSVQTFLWWDPTATGLNLDLVRLASFSHIKQTFAWEDIEPAEGQWHFSNGDRLLGELERRGLSVIVRLTDSPPWAYPSVSDQRANFVDAPPDDLAKFGVFCGTVAERYRGRIDAYQIWNEPNLAREWGGRTPDPVAYVELLRVCSEAIRAVDPDAILISAGLAPTGNFDAGAVPDDYFLRAMYDVDFQQYIDVVGVHAPGYSVPELGPDEAVEQGSHRFFTFRRVEDMRMIMVEYGDAARQMAILEMGWTRDDVHEQYSWYAVDEQEQADYLVRAYTYAAENWRPWMGVMSSIYFADPSWTEENEEYFWSIVSPEGYITPAYIALANMAKYCGEAVLPERDPNSPEALGQVQSPLCGER